MIANEQIFDVAHTYDGQYYSEPEPAPPEYIDALGEGETCADAIFANQNLYNEYQ